MPPKPPNDDFVPEGVVVVVTPGLTEVVLGVLPPPMKKNPPVLTCDRLLDFVQFGLIFPSGPGTGLPSGPTGHGAPACWPPHPTTASAEPRIHRDIDLEDLMGNLTSDHGYTMTVAFGTLEPNLVCAPPKNRKNSEFHVSSSEFLTEFPQFFGLLEWNHRFLWGFSVVGNRKLCPLALELFCHGHNHFTQNIPT